MLPTPQGRAIGDSFPVDRNSKTRIAGQLRQEAGPCKDHVFLFLEVRRLPIPPAQEGSLGSKRSYDKGCSPWTPF